MIKVQTITPELAAEILAGQNTHNRSLRADKVHALADDMANDRWADNGETLKFAADGTLLDGQHRLAAVVEAGRSISFLVVTGLPSSAQETMDTGAKRTFGDVLALRGEHQAVVLASACRIVWEYERSGSTIAVGHLNASPTHAQLSEVLRTHPDLREAAIVGARIGRAAPPLSASLGSLLAYLFRRIDLEDAEGFVEGLCTGAGLEPGSPILALRNLLQNYDQRSHVRPDRRMLVGASIKAWNAYRAGEPMRLLTFRPGGAHPERFPEPK